jgi:predicted transcriptional regulator
LKENLDLLERKNILTKMFPSEHGEVLSCRDKRKTFFLERYMELTSRPKQKIRKSLRIIEE